MKNILLICLVFLFCVGSVHSATLNSMDKISCQKLLKIAEKKEIEGIYERCGFDNEFLAWYEWAPFVSANGYKKALYELCQRYPEHDYSELYCQKSADLDYAPAYFALAKLALNRGEMNLYENHLNKVIELNDVKGKLSLKTEADLASRQAYEELGKLYYKKQDERTRELSLQYLQVAADLGSASAAHMLGVALSWNLEPEQQVLSEKYLWQAILQGCPAAEENLGLINYLKQGRLHQNDAYTEIEKRSFSCQPSPKTSKKLFMSKKDCDCTQVLSWAESQKNKPFMISNIVANSALLKDKNGMEYSVVKGDKVSEGFVVEEVRPTAVIVRRVNERHILLYRDDIECVDLCVDSDVVSKKKASQLPPYAIIFSEEECQKLARGIETLTNPLKPFKGLPECQLQDWKRWGKQAMDEKRNKHLFLLANYEKSDYVPARVSQMEMLIRTEDARYKDTITNLLDYSTRSMPIDTLSEMKKEQAYCLGAKMYMDGVFKDETQAFTWAKAGADEGYVQSVNMLGVLYAKGFGVPKDKQKAAELFRLADEFSLHLNTDALENLKVIESNADLGKLRYGNCEEIIQHTPVDIERLFDLYK